MKTFKDFKSFNKYFGTEAPLNDQIDVGAYGDQFLMQSEAVALDYHRFSLKQRLHFPSNHPLQHLNKKKVSALFYSSPKDINPWYVERRFGGYYIQFSNKIINENKHIFKKLMDFGQHEPLFLNKEEEQEIENIYKAMLAHYKANPEGHDILLAYSLVLFNWIENLYLKQYSQKLEDFNEIIIAFQKLLQHYYDKTLEDRLPEIPSVQYFAEELQLSPNYLGDLIKKHTGDSAIEHIHNHIIKLAKKNLTKTNLPINQIAENLGFEYSTYFTRFFKKKTGLTPKQFRNQ